MPINGVFEIWMDYTPLKSKTGIEVSNAFKPIVKHRRPDKLWVDKEK